MPNRQSIGQFQEEVKEKMSLGQTILQTATHPARMVVFGGGGFIFGAISAVSILIVAVGIFYVLMKLGGLLDAMKERTESSSTKK
jgi:hypothetical protein